MSGDYEEKFATLRAFYGLMMAHPGAKLIFMGQEFGQFIEWDFSKGLDWLLLDYEAHNKLKRYVAELIHFYRGTSALWQNDRDWNGYQWLKVDDRENSILAFMRLSNSKREKIIAISNFTPIERKNYKIGVPQSGIYKEVFNSNWMCYGGNENRTEEDNTLYLIKKEKCDDKPCSLNIDLPPLTTIFLKKV
jgi:1,4-alpha-glucan branching enzyme